MSDDSEVQMTEDVHITVDADRMTFADMLLLVRWPAANWTERIGFLQRVVVQPDVLTLPVSALDSIFEELRAANERKRNPENLP